MVQNTDSSGRILLAHDLRKRYPQGRGWIEALKGVSLELFRGEILTLLGPNGAGKTTLVKVLAGLVEPNGGKVEARVKGRRVWMGAVLEGNRNLYWRLTSLENLIYFGTLRGLTPKEARQRGLELLEAVKLSDKAHQTVGTLSRGQQQRAALAAALTHDPSVLFLDEPTLGVDLEAQEAIRSWLLRLKNDGKAILLTTHQLDLAEVVADRVAILLEGQVALEGRTREVLEGSPWGSLPGGSPSALRGRGPTSRPALGLRGGDGGDGDPGGGGGNPLGSP